jgi:hypothetical protein
MVVSVFHFTQTDLMCFCLEGFDGINLDRKNSFVEVGANDDKARLDFDIFPSCPPPVLTVCPHLSIFDIHDHNNLFSYFYFFLLFSRIRSPCSLYSHLAVRAVIVRKMMVRSPTPINV